MNNDGYRKNGGIGFAINGPQLLIDSERGPKFNLTDLREKSLSNAEIERIAFLVEEITKELGLAKSISVTLRGQAGSHHGFGSGTGIRLGILESLLIINDFQYDRERLVRLSNRGGTSGIGINTYFDGSFVLDLGRKDYLHHELLPSSSNEKYQLLKPLVLASIKMPDWQMGICIPTDINSKTGEEEREFFQKTCPISDSSVYEILYHSIYGVAASLIENDYETFCDSINKLQLCEWKHSERSLYGNRIAEIEKMLLKNGARAVGMSSLGPCLYFFSKDIKSVIELTNSENRNLNLFITKPINTGRLLSYG